MIRLTFNSTFLYRSVDSGCKKKHLFRHDRWGAYEFPWYSYVDNSFWISRILRNRKSDRPTRSSSKERGERWCKIFLQIRRRFPDDYLFSPSQKGGFVSREIWTPTFRFVWGINTESRSSLVPSLSHLRSLFPSFFHFPTSTPPSQVLINGLEKPPPSSKGWTWITPIHCHHQSNLTNRGVILKPIKWIDMAQTLWTVPWTLIRILIPISMEMKISEKLSWEILVILIHRFQSQIPNPLGTKIQIHLNLFRMECPSQPKLQPLLLRWMVTIHQQWTSTSHWIQTLLNLVHQKLLQSLVNLQRNLQLLHLLPTLVVLLPLPSTSSTR